MIIPQICLWPSCYVFPRIKEVNIDCHEKHVVSIVLCGKSPFKMCSNTLHSTIQDPIKSTRQSLYTSWKTCISYVQNMYLFSRCKLGRQLQHGSSYHNTCTVKFGRAKPRQPYASVDITYPNWQFTFKYNESLSSTLGNSDFCPCKVHSWLLPCRKRFFLFLQH